jgi:hypothetical protein
MMITTISIHDVKKIEATKRHHSLSHSNFTVTTLTVLTGDSETGTKTEVTLYSDKELAIEYPLEEA